MNLSSEVLSPPSYRTDLALATRYEENAWMSTGQAHTDRDETPGERADRNWNDLLQEFRVLQTGVQLLGGFLLTLPFQSAFKDLDDLQRGLYLTLVVLATVTTTTVLAPIAVHRRLFRWQRKDRLVAVGHRIAQVVLVLVALLVTGIAIFVFDVVLSRSAALAVGAAMLFVVLLSLLVLPFVAGGRRPDDVDDLAQP